MRSRAHLFTLARLGRPVSAMLLTALLGLSGQAGAVCVKVDHYASEILSPDDQRYVDPASGTHNFWTGVPDQAGASGLQASVNLNTTTFQPNGTLLASGSASFLNMGLEPYSPEQVLFRCDAADANNLYEYYATNGDSVYGGMFEDGAAFGVPGAYRTAFNGMVIRVTHAATGNYFKRNWQARPLTNLDKDPKGKILVKAKNFSDVRVELFRVGNDTTAGGWSEAGNYSYSQPAAYIAFRGGGLSDNLAVGRDSASYYDGWYGHWPGAVNLFNHLTVYRSATCAVTNVTPNVTFPLISVAELESGATRQLPIDISFKCQTGAPANTGLSPFEDGTGAGRTAMGVLVPAANFQSAVSQGLTTGASGVTLLLSDDYGQPGVAGGVGVALSKTDGSALNFLGNEQVTGGGAAAGWYPVMQGATQAGQSGGITSYTKRLNASLTRIPGRSVTPGRLNARAQVVIRVQ